MTGNACHAKSERTIKSEAQRGSGLRAIGVGDGTTHRGTGLTQSSDLSSTHNVGSRQSAVGVRVSTEHSALVIGASVLEEHLAQKLRRVLGPAHRHAAHSCVHVQRVVVAARSGLVAEEVDLSGPREAVLLEEAHAVALVPPVRVHVQRDLAACNTCTYM